MQTRPTQNPVQPLSKNENDTLVTQTESPSTSFFLSSSFISSLSLFGKPFQAQTMPECNGYGACDESLSLSALYPNKSY